ncbi:SDR family oxidoreductase [Aureimonas sp. ME7]|uniref:SDR family oxidoreductase n=1 Tax=Aureimonas sp. ME7 TaxID=2744252 RepID=UPI0015F59626|nr:SDR family oxidoreductase [Aureimonas sp. ME7]
MAQELAGKVAAVTGGASGIGLECARTMLRAGARVFIVDNAQDRLDKAVADLGEGATALRVDITSGDSVATMLPAILDKAGQLDIFHANAGSYIGGDLVDGNADAFDRMLNLNVNAVFRGVHAVLPHMIERGTGDVIVTSSVAGHQSIPWEPVYSASKFAVQSFVHAVRRQVNKHGVRVGAIAPGPVVTPLVDDWPAENLKRAIENGALFQPVEVAEAVLFMLTRPRNIVVRDLVLLPQNFDI